MAEPLNQKRLAAAIRAERFEWRLHALARMAERAISQEDVLRAVCEGQIIEEYPEDRPCASALFLGLTRDSRPMHVVAALDADKDFGHVITAYFPEETHFQADWKTRRES